MTERTFRILLVAHIATSFFGSFIGGVFPELLPPNLAEAYATAEAASVLGQPWAWAFVLPVALAGLAAYIGLFFFRNWGRRLAIPLTILNFFFYPLLGPVAMSWPESVLTDIGSILGGAVLALAYVGPVATRFGANNSSKPTPLRGAA